MQAHWKCAVFAVVFMLSLTWITALVMWGCSGSTNNDCELSCSASADVLQGISPLQVSFSSSAKGDCTPYEFLWVFGDGQTSTSQNPAHTFTSESDTVYHAVLTVTDSEGHTCQKQFDIHVTHQTSSFTCSPTAEPDSGALPLSVQFHANLRHGVAPFSYSWSFGDYSESSESDPVHSYTSSGTYYVHLKVQDGNGDSAKTILPLAIKVRCPAIALQASVDYAAGCAPLDVKFSAAGSGGCPPLGYVWNFGDGNLSTILNATHRYSSAGTFKAILTATDGVGNSEADTITIEVSNEPLVCSGAADISSGCAPLSVEFASNNYGGCPPYVTSWEFGDGSVASGDSVNHSYTQPGSYVAIVTVSDSKSHGCSDSIQIQVEGGTALVCGIGGELVGSCPPVSICFDGEVSGGCQPYTYLWLFGDGDSSTVENPCHVFRETGLFHVSLRVSDRAGVTCTKSANATIDAVGTLNCAASCSQTSGCAPFEASFSANVTGGCAPYSFHWDFADGATSSERNPRHTFSVSDDYQVILSVADDRGTSAQDTLIVTVGGGLPLSCSASSDVLKGCAPLEVNFSGAANGGCAPYSFLWEFDDGSTSTLLSPAHVYSQSGNFTAKLTVTDAANAKCQKTARVEVAGGLPLTCEVSSNIATGCAPIQIGFTAEVTGGCAPYQTLWQFGDGGSSAEVEPAHFYQMPGSYVAEFTVTDALGKSCRKSVGIIVTGGQMGCAAAASAESGCRSLTVNFLASVSLGCPGYSYLWDFGDGARSDLQNPSHTYTLAGKFPVRLTVTDSRAITCQDEHLTITVTSSALNTPSSPTPASGAVNLGSNITLSWTSIVDSCGGNITYDVYHGTTSPPPLVASGRTVNEYALGTSDWGDTYYWRIVARASGERSVTGPIWSYRTNCSSALTAITDPSPSNNALGQPTSLTIRWSGGTDRCGWPVKYDIYGRIGSVGAFTKIRSDYTLTSLRVSDIPASTTYYWYIVSKGEGGRSVTGPTWRFTTR